jgi:hypothetical protein
MAPTARDRNPFHHQGPIWNRDAFFNRDADVRKVLTRLRKGQSVSVVGREKIGKTSFLRYVSDSQVAARYSLMPQKYLFCYVDCKQLANLSEDGCFDQIKAVVAEAISTWEASPVSVPEDAACPDAYFWLNQTLLLFDQVGVQLIAQLDDFDWLADNERLSLRWLDNLRAFSEEAPGTVAYLTTSRVSLVDLREVPRIAGSPFFDIFWEYQLQSFDAGAARGFLERRLGPVGAVFPEGVLELIGSLSRGEPHRLQLAGDCAYDVWCEKGRRPLCDGDCGEIQERFERELQPGSGDSR